MKKIILSLVLLSNSVFAEINTFPSKDLLNEVLEKSYYLNSEKNLIDIEKNKKEILDNGVYEWNVKTNIQNRVVKNTGEKFNEYSVGLERSIRTNGKKDLDIKLGDENVELSLLKFENVKLDFKRKFIKDWFSFLKENETYKYNSEIYNILEKENKNIKKRNKLGDVSKLEVLLSDAILSQSQIQMIQSNNQKLLSEQLMLKKYSMLNLDKVIIDTPKPYSILKEDLHNKIVMANVDLKMAQKESIKQQILVKRNEKNLTPDPTVGFYVSNEKNGGEGVFGVSLSIPLSGSSRKNNVNISNLEAISAFELEKQVLQDLNLKIDEFHIKSKFSYDVWLTSLDNKEKMFKSYELIKKAYFLGENNISEVMFFYKNYNEASLAEIKARIDFFEFKYLLSLELGEI